MVVSHATVQSHYVNKLCFNQSLPWSYYRYKDESGPPSKRLMGRVLQMSEAIGRTNLLYLRPTFYPLSHQGGLFLIWTRDKSTSFYWHYRFFVQYTFWYVAGIKVFSAYVRDILFIHKAILVSNWFRAILYITRQKT